MNLVLFRPAELGHDGELTLADDRARHLLDVLRVVPGSEVRVGQLDGGVGTATVLAAEAGRVTLRCRLGDPPPRPRVDLLLALPRPKVLRRLWAQLAALGVGRVMLTNAERVERNYFDTHLLTPAVYEPLLIEGLQQARDTWLPRVSVHRQFRPLIEDELATLAPGTVRLVAEPGTPVKVSAALGGAAADARVLLAIGPEGGWNTFELARLDAHGFTRIGMQARTLRSDTACVALLTLVHDALGA